MYRDAADIRAGRELKDLPVACCGSCRETISHVSQSQHSSFTFLQRKTASLFTALPVMQSVIVVDHVKSAIGRKEDMIGHRIKSNVRKLRCVLLDPISMQCQLFFSFG